MQEEVESRTVTLAISATKLTGRVMKSAISKYLAWRKDQKPESQSVKPTGKHMSLTLEDFGKDYVLTLKGQMTHRVTLGKDARGNLTRIDNVLNQMPERLKNVEAQLQTLYAQVEAAKAELGKPFPQEAELRQKSERLTELNTLLDMDGKGSQERTAEESAVAKSS